VVVAASVVGVAVVVAAADVVVGDALDVEVVAADVDAPEADAVVVVAAAVLAGVAALPPGLDPAVDRAALVVSEDLLSLLHDAAPTTTTTMAQAVATLRSVRRLVRPSAPWSRSCIAVLSFW
jgi:hypothetical protein